MAAKAFKRDFEAGQVATSERACGWVVPVGVKVRRLVVLAALGLASTSVSSVSAKTYPGSIDLFPWPGRCSSPSVAHVGYWATPGFAVPPGARTIIEASWDYGQSWLRAGTMPWNKEGLPVRLDELTSRADRSSRFRDHMEYRMQVYGFMPWLVRARVARTGYISEPTEVIFDQEAPQVELVSPSGFDPTVDDSSVLDRPVTVVSGKATLRAIAIDDGVGFGQSVLVLFRHHDTRPALWWTLRNDVTGEETVLAGTPGNERIVEEQRIDFSEHRGPHTLTVTAEDCVGNRSSRTMRLLSI